MSKMVILDCDATEFNVLPLRNNTRNIFVIHNDSLIINFCDKDEKILAQSEIEIKDARTLAKLINLLGNE